MVSGVYYGVIYFSTAANRFTGFNQARLSELLTGLALLSVLVWVIVVLSTFARVGAQLALFSAKRGTQGTQARKDEA